MFIDGTTLTSLIINVVAAVIFFVLGMISRTIFDIIRKKNPARNFWNGCLNSVNIIIPSLPTDYDEFSLHTGYNDLKASTKITSLLSSFGNSPEEIEILEARYARDRLDNNVVLIGGPITNEITRRIMQDFRLPFSFNGHTLMNAYHDKRYEPKLDENGHVLEDYAFIFKTKNPYNNSKSLVIVAGCFGYGTYAGAATITDYEILRNISKEFKKIKERSIGVIVKSYIIDEMPQRPSVIEFFKVDESYYQL